MPEYAPLVQDRYITGLYTQRSPLRDGDTPYMYSKVYGMSRYDAILDGLNTEISPRGTLIRRPGLSVYNSATFPQIFRWYPFHLQIDGVSIIKVLADCPGVIYDATGPSTKAVVFTKTAGAGKTTFQAVGNTLYFTNGVDLKKWVISTKSYQAGRSYKPFYGATAGDFINDPNGNIQVAAGGMTVPIVGVSAKSNVVTIELDTTSPNLPDNLKMLVGVKVTFSGLGVATFLNGQTLAIQSVPTASTFTVVASTPDFTLVPDSGSATTGNGTAAGVAAGGWATSPGAITADGGQQWICKGSAVQNWGIVGPNTAPTRTQTPLPVVYPAWQANSYYSTCYLIYNAANVIQKVTRFGTTGANEPSWNNATGASTTDGSAQWTSQGSGVYSASTPYAAGAYIFTADAFGNLHFYQAIVAGTSGASAPTFPSALGSSVTDNGIVWENVGVAQQWSNITASTISGNFGIIPLAGSKSLVIGCGQNQPNGTAIALPSGYSTSRMASWSSPCTGYGGQISGVYQSTSSGGVTQSSFSNRSNGWDHDATSNWVAVAWSDDSAVTVSYNGGFQYIQFTTAQGDTLCIAVGSLYNGSSVTVPSGFGASQFVYIAGMASTDNTGNGMQGVQYCSLDATLKLTTQYNDNNGHTWSGYANVFGVFWKSGGGVTLATVTGGTAILIPTTTGSQLAIIQANLASGGSFGLPTGFGSASVLSTAAMSGWSPSSSNVAHGWAVTVTAQTLSAQYQDGGGHTWNGSANIFALAALLATTAVVQPQTIVDGNGFLEGVVQSGVSGSNAPVWNQNTGGQTTDKNAKWQNEGGYSIAGTEPTKWGYSYKYSVTNAVSNISPISNPLTLDQGNQAVLTGNGSPDPQVDTIVIWRIPQGGSTFEWLDEIPAPPGGAPWTYTDNNPDSALNPLITAPVGLENSPPPAGLNYIAYHMNRIWGAEGSIVQWCTGPDTSYGNGLEAWNPAYSADLTNTIYRFEPVTLSENGALLCFTTAHVYGMFGLGTSSSPFLPRMYAKGIGILNYDAIDVIGSTMHMFTTARKQISLDPSAGYIETGYPIGDQFNRVTTGGVNAALFDPSTAMVTWHEQSSGDTALYVSDGATGWFRYSPAMPPDSGFLWSPLAQIAGGISAVQSVETTPGVKTLLVGPKTSGPILMRNGSTNADNGAIYSNTYARLGSIQLVSSGMIAEVAWIQLDSVATGTAPTVGVLLDEINTTADIGFDMLDRTAADPPLLPASETLFNDRFTLMQNGLCPLGRHMQMLIQWSAENSPSELLQHTIYGAKHAERQ